MLDDPGPVKVFWPSNAPSSQVPGVVIGWKNSDVEFFVLTVLEAVEVRLSNCQMAGRRDAQCYMRPEN
jgi:hypothetical protein